MPNYINQTKSLISIREKESVFEVLPPLLLIIFIIKYAAKVHFKDLDSFGLNKVFNREKIQRKCCTATG